MDSEHRHELAENDLARVLKQFGAKFEGYGGPIVAGAIAICAVLIGMAVVRGQSSATAQEAWAKLGSATIPENYATVAEEYAGTEVAAWARLNEGRLFLQEGIREAFQDKESSEKALASAKTAFQAAVDNPAAPAEVRSSALFGLATHAETVSDGDTSAAVAAYKKYINEFPEGASRKYAEHRIEVLESDDAQEFYAWFSKQEPKRESITGPNDGISNIENMFPSGGDAVDGENPFESLKPDDKEEAADDSDAAADTVKPETEKPAAADAPAEAGSEPALEESTTPETEEAE